MDADSRTEEPAVAPGSNEALLGVVPGEDPGGSPPSISQLPGQYPGAAPSPSDDPADDDPEHEAARQHVQRATPRPEMDPEQAEDFLDVLLSAEAPPPLPTAGLVIKRPDGSLHARLTVRGLGEDENQSIEDRCWRDSTLREKKMGAGPLVRDMARIKRLTVATAAMSGINDPRVLAKFGPTVEHVVQRWLLPGEIDKITDEISDLSGYATDSVEKVGKR